MSEALICSLSAKTFNELFDRYPSIAKATIRQAVKTARRCTRNIIQVFLESEQKPSVEQLQCFFDY